VKVTRANEARRFDFAAQVRVSMSASWRQLQRAMQRVHARPRVITWFV
jgi:hypothetical protein